MHGPVTERRKRSAIEPTEHNERWNSEDPSEHDRQKGMETAELGNAHRSSGQMTQEKEGLAQQFERGGPFTLR